jgi:hypothetical protein
MAKAHLRRCEDMNKSRFEAFTGGADADVA